jgi:hypothetical protein
VHDFDFAAFMREFALSRAFCSKVFGVSERTVTRWRSARKIPASALQLARTIEHQAAPWNAGFRRGWWCGVVGLDWAWRQALFAPPGGQWQDYRTPEHRRAVARDAAQRALECAAEDQARRRARLQAGRKAAATRAARRDHNTSAVTVRPGRGGFGDGRRASARQSLSKIQRTDSSTVLKLRERPALRSA